MKANSRFEGPSGAPVATLGLWDDHVTALTKRFRAMHWAVVEDSGRFLVTLVSFLGARA